MLYSGHKTENLVNLLWAKTNPYKTLLPHMIDAGCCAGVYLSAPASSALLSFLAEQWNVSSEETLNFVAYLVAMHDIGKATPQFQMQSDDQLIRLRDSELKSILPDTKLPPVRHEYLSKRIATRIWKSRAESRRIYDAYSCILSLHHQKPDESQRMKVSVHEMWEYLQDEIESQIRDIFSFTGNLPVPRNMDPVCIILTGITILCDWIASSGPFDTLSLISDDYYHKSMAIAQNAVKQYGLIENNRIGEIDSFQSLYPHITSPREIQKKCEILLPSAPLTIIEAPMGEGKTEAALYMAARYTDSKNKRGIYVALPTQATSNQMYSRFIGMLEESSGAHARLLHGTAFLMKGEAGEIQSEDSAEAEKWLGSSRMGLLDENGVGTIDQAMGAVLKARFSVLRLLGLCNKALIIDELHAYDAYMSQIIESLLLWCKALSVPVVLLSATLQNSQKKRYLSCYIDTDLPAISENYPLITQVTEDKTVVQTDASASMQTDYEFKTKNFGQDEFKIAGFALEKISNGGCYCILANTVKHAQAIYRALQEMKDPETEILLFHARFTMERREKIEKECLEKFGKEKEQKRPGKAILVATQVVEQSLDIDFDGMISELAPIDLLLQRAGRVHRHRNRVRPQGMENPVIHIILPETEETTDPEKRYGPCGRVYAPFLLYNTEILLGAGRNIQVPQDVRSVINTVYEAVSEENMRVWQERAFSQQLMEANAKWVAFPPPQSEYFFPTQSHPEFEDVSIDDGFDPTARAVTRFGEPTFRISFSKPELLSAATAGRLSKAQQKEILLSSVSLRLTPDVQAGLRTSNVYQIRKGALFGCYITDHDDEITIGEKRLINDPTLGVYWGD